MTEVKPAGTDENPPIVSMVSFLTISALVAIMATFLTSIGYRLAGTTPDTTVFAIAAISGFMVSTVGWGIVMRGFTKSPEKMIGYYGGGVLAKVILAGLALAVVIGLEMASASEFLLPFAAVFFLTGFAQLFIAIKGASKLLDAADVGRVWEQPAAPGAARSPEDRDVHDSDGE